MTRRGKDDDNKGIPLRDMSKHAQQIGEMGRRVLGGRRTSGEGLDDRDEPRRTKETHALHDRHARKITSWVDHPN